MLTSDSPNPCLFGSISTPLLLGEAVGRALCGNPKTRLAWATIQLKAAAVRIGKESYLPSLAATVKEVDSNTRTHLKHDGELDTSANGAYPAGTVSLSWILYDFGQRRDQLESARQLLAAARADLDLNLQQVFLQVAADYYDAQAAQASLAAAREIEGLTQRSLGAAHIRVDKGVAPLSDELQAQTAHAQAVLNRVKTDADLKSKQGALAVDMGLDPDRTVSLPQSNSEPAAQGPSRESLRELLEEAKRSHPSVAEAARELAAAEADERAARSHTYPTISLIAGVSRSNEPLTPSLGSPSVPGSVTNRSVGIQIDIPISDPLWRRGQIAQAHARVVVQQEALRGTQQQVAQDLWNSYTTLQADIDNLTNSSVLLESARQSFESSQHRYEGGAGNILELLTSQAAYANATQQRIQAVSDWRIARLALAASLGRLGMWDTQDSP